MSSPDQRFMDIFMLVIGLLVAIAVGLILIARSVGNSTQREWIREDKVYDQLVAERLRPAGRAALPGEDDAAGAAAPAVAAPVAAPLSGAQVYNQACNSCHGAGIAGAPKLSDKANWSARIAQGKPVLYKHALEGFQGSSGYMPPKGGWTDLSDGEVTSAVDYMVAQSQ